MTNQQSGAVRSTATMLRLEGPDALGLLHRISTQSLVDLAAGQVRSTLFCDFRGRLLHRAAVAVTSNGAVWLVREDAPPEELLAFVEKHVFRENVRLEEYARGRGVQPAPDGFGLPAGTCEERDDAPLRLQLGADYGVTIGATAEPDPADSERRRLLAGRPRHGHEVRDAFDPFEVGLAHEVHLSKGCFTGQEALMRMVTYRGLRRRLARVSGTGAVPRTPGEIRGADRKAGVLTSATAHGDAWIGLAVIDGRVVDEATAFSLDGAKLERPTFFPETRPLGLP